MAEKSILLGHSGAWQVSLAIGNLIEPHIHSAVIIAGIAIDHVVFRVV